MIGGGVAAIFLVPGLKEKVLGGGGEKGDKDDPKKVVDNPMFSNPMHDDDDEEEKKEPEPEPEKEPEHGARARCRSRGAGARPGAGAGAGAGAGEGGSLEVRVTTARSLAAQRR